MIRCLKIRRVSCLFHVRAIFGMMKFNFILSARVLYFHILCCTVHTGPFSTPSANVVLCIEDLQKYSTDKGEAFAVLESPTTPVLSYAALTLQSDNKRRATYGSGYFGSVLKRLTLWLGVSCCVH